MEWKTEPLQMGVLDHLIREEDFRAPYLRSWSPGSMVPLGMLVVSASWSYVGYWKGLMLSIPASYPQWAVGKSGSGRAEGEIQGFK